MRHPSRGCAQRVSWSWTLCVEGGGDVVLVGDVLRQLLCALGRCGRDESVAIRTLGSGVLSHARGAGREDQSQEMGGLLRKDGVGFGTRARFVARDHGNASQVIALIE